MAPKKGTKRAAPASTEDTVDKKTFEFLKTQGIGRPTYKAIIEALEHPYLAVPDECRKMLSAMVAKSLCMPIEERHELQVQCIDMIGDAIQQVKAKLQEAIDTEQVAVTAAEQSKCDLENKLNEAKDSLAQEHEKLEAATQILTDASEAVLSAKAALNAKQEEQKSADAGINQIKADKEAFDSAIQNDLKKLMDGSWEEGQSSKHFQALAALFGKFVLEDSLQAVLQGTLNKKPEERGSFDLMAVTQLEQSMQAKLNELNTTLEQHGPQVREREAAVAAAQKGFDDAAAAQKDAATALSAAQELEKTGMASASAAECALAAGEQELKKASEVRDQKTFEFEAFQYHTGCFEQLKERSSIKAAPSPAKSATSPAKAAPVITNESQDGQPAVAGA